MQIRDWLDKNISVVTPVGVTERRNFDYVPNASASKYIREHLHPEYYQKAAALIGDSFPPNVRQVVYLSEFQKSSKIENLEAALQNIPLEYIVDSYSKEEDRLIKASGQYRLKQVAHFSPRKDIVDTDLPSIVGGDSGFIFARYLFPLFGIERAGPYFDVLEVEESYKL